jgi:hypothetical protein
MVHQQSEPFSELENACPSEISIHFPNWKESAHPGPIFELKNYCPSINNTSVLPPNPRVISSFFNKEVVSMSSILSMQTLSSWTESLPKMFAYLLICGYMYWRTTFSFLDFITDNVMLDFKCTSVWNTFFL